MTVMIDSSAWMEYFFGSEKGAKIDKIIRSPETILSNAIVEFEVLHVMEKRRSKGVADAALKYLQACSHRVDLSPEVVIEGVGLKRKHSLGMGDALIAATSLRFNAKLLSSDNDFRKVKGAEIL